jgi:hypothetical protein
MSTLSETEQQKQMYSCLVFTINFLGLEHEMQFCPANDPDVLQIPVVHND